MANDQAKMKPTLGLAGLTVNAMALIAPGAFLWLTFGEQCLYGAPMAGCTMWFGFLMALALCFATAMSYAELSKLYPGAGSSYVYAEQAFLHDTHKFKFARVAKFITGWSSHLYYWIYPGVMVGVTALMVGYVIGYLYPSTFSAATPSPLFMIAFCIIFPFAVTYIAYKGVVSATSVNLVINIIQITALFVFSIMAISYRMNHPEGSVGYVLNPDGVAINQVISTDKSGSPIKDAAGNYVYDKNPDGSVKSFTVSYAADQAITQGADGKTPTFQFHTSAGSVLSYHGFSFAMIQACIAILCLCGFESCCSLAEEAKRPLIDTPRAIYLALIIQGGICYLFEYFAANYFLHNGYTMTTASGSPAPIGDMMVICGTWLFGSYAAGKAFMLIEAATVFIALVGTTLSCMNTGARVTFAMGRDEEMGEHFGILHDKHLTPSRALWVLAVISAVIGIFSVVFYFCGGAALTDAAITALPHNFWYSFGLIKNATAVKIPQSLLVVTLASNFGMFLFYGLTNAIAIVAFREHHSFNGFKHMVVPVFGVVANLGCMLFYLVGPFSVAGMSWKEPFVALGVAACWGIYGLIYFSTRSKSKGKLMIHDEHPMPELLTKKQFARV